MGAREQAQRLMTGAAELSDALQALAGAATIVEEISQGLAWTEDLDPRAARCRILRRVVTILHTQYGRMVDVGETMRDVAEQIGASADTTGPFVPVRIVTRSGAPLTDMDLPPLTVGDTIQLEDNHPWRVVAVAHQRRGGHYRATVAVTPIAWPAENAGVGS